MRMYELIVQTRWFEDPSLGTLTTKNDDDLTFGKAGRQQVRRLMATIGSQRIYFSPLPD